MGWAIRTIRAVVVVAVVAGAGLAVAPPASAATQTINGTVVAPISAPYGNFGDDMQGVLVDGVLGVALFRSTSIVSGCVRINITITHLDGSVLNAVADSCPGGTGVVLVPGLLVDITYPTTVVGGTGRFGGASGSGHYRILRANVPNPFWGVIPVGPVVVGTLSLQLTTP
jgi:hypothetical protein